MGTLIIDNKKVKSITIDGKKVKSFLLDGKLFNFAQPKTVKVTGDPFNVNPAFSFNGKLYETWDYSVSKEVVDSFDPEIDTIQFDVEFPSDLRNNQFMIKLVGGGSVKYIVADPTFKGVLGDSDNTYTLKNGGTPTPVIPAAPEIEAGEYESIGHNASGDVHTFVNLNSRVWDSYNFKLFEPLAKPISLQVKAGFTLAAGLNRFRVTKPSISGFAYNTIHSTTLQAGHTYKFEEGKDPVDMGTY